ncbi:MAG: PqqD family peptide modification chaperone [bacterium]|nr:MAG: PqqD family peptide modification chaperone [bacterium]
MPGLVHTERDSIHLLLHPERPRWVAANRMGWEILGLCDGSSTIRSIASRVAKRYDADPGQVEGDVIAFIRSLADAQLILTGADGGMEGKPPVSIRSIFLHLTDRCNLRCIHCYVGSTPSVDEELESSRIHGLIDELADLGGRGITFSGGEPLLRKDWLEIFEHAAERLTATLNTNGTLIKEATAAQLARLDPHIQVSLDGPNADVHDRIRGTGTFDAAVRGIRLLQEKGLGERLVISMTLMKQNIGSAPEMLSFVQRLGAPKLRFLPLHSQGRARSSWATLDATVEDYLAWYRHVYYEWRADRPGLELAGGLPGYLLYVSSSEEEPWCGIGRRVVIGANGDVQPCSLLMDEAFTLGNIKRMSLREIEASDRLGELTASCLARKERIPECRECTWRNFCQASCPAFAFLERGTLLATDDYCDFRRRLFEDSIFRIARTRESGVSP